MLARAPILQRCKRDHLAVEEGSAALLRRFGGRQVAIGKRRSWFRVAAALAQMLREKGAIVSYNDPYFPTVGHGRHYALDMTNTPLDNLSQYDAVLIVTDHSTYDYRAIVEQSQLVIDTRNATKGIDSQKIVRC